MTTVNRTKPAMNLSKPADAPSDTVQPAPELQPEDAVVDDGPSQDTSIHDFPDRPRPSLADSSAAVIDTDNDDNHDMTVGNQPSPPHSLPNNATTALSTGNGGALATRQEAYVPDGHDDLEGEIGFGSFPILKLENGEYVIDGVTLGHEVHVILLSSRKKWIVKEKEQDTEYLLYTYDRETIAGSEELVKTRLKQWAEEGVDVEGNLEVKRYQEVVAVFVSAVGEHKKAGEQFEHELVLCSIPPTSVKRMAGYRATLKTIHKVVLKDVVTRCIKGRQIEAKNKKKYNPWDFKALRRAKPEDITTLDLSGSDVELGDDPDSEK